MVCLLVVPQQTINDGISSAGLHTATYEMGVGEMRGHCNSSTVNVFFFFVHKGKQYRPMRLYSSA